MNINLGHDEITRRTCVITVTYYRDTSDIRFQLALKLCKLATQHKVHLFIVDGSPDHASIRDQFLIESKGYIHVLEQDRDKYPGKGGSLRQAIRMAIEWIDENIIADPDQSSVNNIDHAAICFTEPEKVDLLNHVCEITKPIINGTTDVVIPTRNDELFRTTYPIEQYHSESFGNLHFNLLARHLKGFQKNAAEGQDAVTLDLLFGPFAFNAKLANGWLNYTGTSWDAQMVPYVRGVRNDDWIITPVEVDFRHPKEMKEQEEGDATWTKKRLMQLNLLFDLLGSKELL